MRLKCREGLLALAVGGVCGCGSPSDLIIGSQTDAGAPASWRLVWHDDFDAIDMSRWELSTHTFAENFADFAAENASISGGGLDLHVLTKPTPFTGKPYTAAEIRTRQEFTYGKFLTSARFAAASGVASTLFSFYDWFLHEPNSMNWNEIVIESSGTRRLYCTYTLHEADAADGRERNSVPLDMPFDITSGFHVYGFEWTPTSVTFTVDGAPIQTLGADVAQKVALPKRLVLSVYPSTRVELEGTFDPQVLPVDAVYDWAEVYAYVAPGAD